MKMISLLKKSVLAAVLAGFCHSALAELHIIIPGGPGGGWDTTARSVGEALMKSGLESRTSFQNMSGGGGGRHHRRDRRPHGPRAMPMGGRLARATTVCFSAC